MARDASFLRQFISDFWDLLPQEDKDLMGAYWHALTMIIADMYNEAFEVTLASTVLDVQIYRTERWNRYQLNSETADIQSQTDLLTLTGVAEEDLSQDAVIYDSLTVTNVGGAIYFSETKTLVDEVISDLVYDNLTSGTVRVQEGGATFVEGRDYRVNVLEGKINRIETGGIPTGTAVTIQYMHPFYEVDTDYTIDQVNRKIVRTAASNIPSGSIVSVVYDYDNTTSDLLGGTGVVNVFASTFTDDDKNFLGVLPGRTLTITSGANVGTYTVLSVASAVSINITGSFVADDAAATYTINAFPYAIVAEETIASIPTMQDLIVDPLQLFREGVDYQIGFKKISFRVVPPTTRTDDGPTLWAERTLLDEKTVYRNFGVLIDFFRESSVDYLNAVKGIWYTFWTGSTHENLLRGLHILLGLPFTTEETTVTAINDRETFILDVSPSADITPDPVRTMPPSGTDAITSPKTVFLGVVAPSTQFTAADIGRKLRISDSAVGNDGYYLIESPLVSLQTVTVTNLDGSPAALTTEPFGFGVRIYEATPLDLAGNPLIDVFSYASNTFTIDDVGRTLRILNSTSVVNDGDYIIAEVLDQRSVRIEPDDSLIGFAVEEGIGGFVAEIYQIDDDTIEVEDANGIAQLYTVPIGLDARVSVGDSLDKFHRLTTGVRIFDKNNTDNFVELQIGRPGVSRFLTQNASTGVGSTDETRALTLLEEHFWLPQALFSASSESTNVSEIFTFLDNLKPAYTDYTFAFADDFQDQLTLVEDLKPEDIVLTIDLTTILRNSWPNIQTGTQTQYQSAVGEVLANTLRSPSTALDISVPARFQATDGAFTAIDEGRLVLIGGSGSGNDGTYVIDKVLNGTDVLVTPDFTADESGGGLTSSVQILGQLKDTTATFTTDAAIEDIVSIDIGTNQGKYKVIEIIDDNNLLIFETAFDGPFAATDTGISFEVISYPWYQDQGSLDFLENFLHERADGTASAVSTFTVDSAVDLDVLGVQAGFLLVIKSGANMDLYNVTAVPTKTTLTIAETFPSSPLGSQDYAICQAGLVRSDIVPTILEVIPI